VIEGEMDPVFGHTYQVKRGRGVDGGMEEGGTCVLAAAYNTVRRNDGTVARNG